MFRSACRVAVAAAVISAAIAFAAPPRSWAQTSPPPTPAAPGPAAPTAPAVPNAPAVSAAPDEQPTAPPPAPQSTATAPSDAFGEDTTLVPRPILYVKGSGTWDSAFETISSSLKKVKTYIDKEGLKADGLPMTIFTATDDTGFDFEAAIPILTPPKSPPRGDVAFGQSPDGYALKFVHRGSYDSLDDTYEAITNYLDDKRLDAKDLIIEEYVTDPLTAEKDKLVVNIFVLIK